MSESTSGGVLRPQQEVARVKPIELFFDLVFVFAIAQLSHALLNHLTFAGILQTLILFVAVWWVWIPILSGIVATAAGIELLLAHPSGHVPAATAAVVAGASAVFLFGELLFKRATAGWYPLSHLVGLPLCGALGYAALHAPPVTLSLLNAGLLTLIAVWETLSLRGRTMVVHQT